MFTPWICVGKFKETEPSWTGFGCEEIMDLQNQGMHGSPLKMQENNLWQWSNFSWQNSLIPGGTIVGWRIYYQDTSGNFNSTEIMSFKLSNDLYVKALQSKWNFVSLPFNRSVNKSEFIVEFK